MYIGLLKKTISHPLYLSWRRQDNLDKDDDVLQNELTLDDKSLHESLTIL